jgi:hypothetical protein
MAAAQIDGSCGLSMGIQADSEPQLVRSDLVQMGTKAAQDRLVQSQLDDVRLLVKGLDRELRATESRQIVLNRRLAEVCGRLNGFQEDQSQLEDRVAAMEAGQKTIASSTQEALRMAASVQQQQDEAEFAACLDGLNRRDALPASCLRLPPHYRQLDQQPEPEGEAQPQADFLAATAQRHLSRPIVRNSSSPRQQRTRRKSSGDVDPWGGCREQMNQHAQQLAELGQAVAGLFARPHRHDASGASSVQQMQSQLEQQGTLLECLDARLWALAEARTCHEEKKFDFSCDGNDFLEKAELVATEFPKLQARMEAHGQEFHKVWASLKLLLPPPNSNCVEGNIVTVQGSCEIDASCKLALPGACHDHAANNKLVLPQEFSAAVQQIELRFHGMCADVIGRCDGLQKIVDQHLQKACDWLPAVEGRVEKLAAQVQDCILRIDAQQLETRGLRAEHDASCRQLVMLADQVACLLE